MSAERPGSGLARTSDLNVADADPASPADRRWSVCLDGDDADLAELARLMNAPELNIVELDGSFLLESTGFEHLGEPRQVLDAAQPLLGVIRGIARLRTPLLRPLTASAVIDHRGWTPITHKFVFPGTARLRIRAFAPTVVAGGAAVQNERPHSLGAELALDDQRVARALGLFGEEPTWSSLYKVLDVLREAVPGKAALENKGWVPTGEIRRFTWTANSFNALGPDARHALANNKAPPKPMLLDEAVALIGCLVEQWLVEKRQTRP